MEESDRKGSKVPSVKGRLLMIEILRVHALLSLAILSLYLALLINGVFALVALLGSLVSSDFVVGTARSA